MQSYITLGMTYTGPITSELFATFPATLALRCCAASSVKDLVFFFWRVRLITDEPIDEATTILNTPTTTQHGGYTFLIHAALQHIGYDIH